MIKNLDMSDHTLYFADVLKAIIEEFNIQQVSRAKIVFRSLKELQDFPINIDTSTVYVFDNRKYPNIDMSLIKISGYSSLYFNTSPSLYDHYRTNINENNYFTSIMNNGDELFRFIIGNSSLKKIDFYTPLTSNVSEKQRQVNVKIPETLEFSKDF